MQDLTHDFPRVPVLAYSIKTLAHVYSNRAQVHVSYVPYVRMYTSIRVYLHIRTARNADRALTSPEKEKRDVIAPY